ncbi:MAG: hypothetical protein OEZ06_12620 [Myxococcales bacterium]|nr:hypothetical protein [Myxococcales bacterium]
MIATRINKLWRAVVGSHLGELEAHHAEALLDQERAGLRRQVATYNRTLAGYAAVCERLRRQHGRLHDERAELEARVAARLEDGDRQAAASDALRMEAIADELSECKRQFDTAEANYADLVSARQVAVDAARQKLEALKRSIGEARVQQALADLSELAADMQGELGLGDGSLDRLREQMEDRRDLAVGRARVARESLDVSAVRRREALQRERAEAALRRFEARRPAPEAPRRGAESREP